MSVDVYIAVIFADKSDKNKFLSEFQAQNPPGSCGDNLWDDKDNFLHIKRSHLSSWHQQYLKEIKNAKGKIFSITYNDFDHPDKGPYLVADATKNNWDSKNDENRCDITRIKVVTLIKKAYKGQNTEMQWLLKQDIKSLQLLNTKPIKKLTKF